MRTDTPQARQAAKARTLVRKAERQHKRTTRTLPTLPTR